MAALVDSAAVNSLGGKGSRPLGPFPPWREQAVVHPTAGSGEPAPAQRRPERVLFSFWEK